MSRPGAQLIICAVGHFCHGRVSGVRACGTAGRPRRKQCCGVRPLKTSGPHARDDDATLPKRARRKVRRCWLSWAGASRRYAPQPATESPSTWDARPREVPQASAAPGCVRSIRQYTTGARPSFRAKPAGRLPIPLWGTWRAKGRATAACRGGARRPSAGAPFRSIQAPEKRKPIRAKRPRAPAPGRRRAGRHQSESAGVPASRGRGARKVRAATRSPMRRYQLSSPKRPGECRSRPGARRAEPAERAGPRAARRGACLSR